MSKFMNDVEKRMILERMSLKTRQAYLRWIKGFILANNKTHPKELNGKDVEIFLSSMADSVAKSTQKQAYFALKYLYEYLEQPLPKINAKRSKKIPQSRFALSVNEVNTFINAVPVGPKRLMVLLMYGSGMRVAECATLRIKDIDIEDETIFIRQGKHNQDRITVLPVSIVPALQEHLTYIKQQHENDISQGIGVHLPGALARKYTNAPFDWGWSWLFPGRVKNGLRGHVSVAGIQKMVKKYGAETFPLKNITSHILRHTFATHYLKNGGRIDHLQELMGHQSLETTLQYVHVDNNSEAMVSPLDVMKA